MPNVQMQDDVLTAIYQEALNAIPYGMQMLQKMFKQNKQNNRQASTYQKAFNRVTRRNRDVLTPQNKEAILKQATQKVLQDRFGLPNVDFNAYDLKVGRGKITLHFNPGNSKTIPLAFWANKFGYEDKAISKAEPEPQRMKLTPQEVETRLTENVQWAEQKETYKERIRQTFAPTEEQIKKIFKDGQPGTLDFSNCEITGYDFSKYNLRGAVFENARLKDCKFNEVSHADFTGAEIHDCDFRGADLRYTTFERSDIQRVVMTRAQLDYTSFNDARPQALDLSGSHTDHTNMDWMDADNVIFDTILVEGIDHDLQRMEDGFQEKPYEGVYLPQQTLESVLDNHRQWMESDGKEGQRADLRGARLTNADISGKDLTGVLVHQHDLANVKYDGKTKFPENIVAPHMAKEEIHGPGRSAAQSPGNFDIGAEEANRIRAVGQSAPQTAPSPVAQSSRPPIAPTHEMMP